MTQRFRITRARFNTIIFVMWDGRVLTNADLLERRLRNAPEEFHDEEKRCHRSFMTTVSKWLKSSKDQQDPFVYPRVMDPDLEEDCSCQGKDHVECGIYAITYFGRLSKEALFSWCHGDEPL